MAHTQAQRRFASPFELGRFILKCKVLIGLVCRAVFFTKTYTYILNASLTELTRPIRRDRATLPLAGAYTAFEQVLDGRIADPHLTA